MLGAYAASTAVACGIGLGALRLTSASPRLRAASLVAPHVALGCAGALSTVLNNQPQLNEGVSLIDEEGLEIGVRSRSAAASTVARATLLQGLLVPSCALLVPTLLFRRLLLPRLWMSAPQLLPLAASATIMGCVTVLTPLTVAMVPAFVPISWDNLEEENKVKVLEAQGSRLRGASLDGSSIRLFSGRVLY